MATDSDCRFLKWQHEDLRKPCEERRIHITKDAFKAVCKTFEVSGAFLEIVLRKNQVGRLGFGCYLHPGKSEGSPPKSMGKRQIP